MADIAGAVAAFLALGKCLHPIKRQLNYLRFFSRNIQDFKDEVNKLVDAKVGLQMRVTTALDNAEIIVPDVETWLKDADEIQKKIIGIESEITNILGGSCLAVRSRYSLSKKIKKTTEAMKELRDNCKFYPNARIAERPPPPARVAVPLGSTNDFESRRQIEDDIMTCLMAGKVNMLGICGMGGVGKTTMAKRVMNKAREHNLFDEIVIAVVSQSADMSKVQKEIAESLGLKLEDETLFVRAHKLGCRLMQGGKRILIVLDDVWESLKLEDLGIPRESGSKRCTVLLTSRDRDVLNEMGAQQISGIQTLSNEEAWSLFREKVGVCADDPNLLSIAQEIVDECKGLPIAIVNVAAALKDKHKYTWDHALQQLRNGNPVDMSRVIAHVYKPLKLSYDSLDNQNAQSIFLLCCLFPEDSIICIEDLIPYVWGLRMFEGNMDLKEVRNMTYSLVEKLKSRFLLLEVDGQYEHYVRVLKSRIFLLEDEDYFRMHDVVRDVAIFIASKEKKLIKCGANSIWLSPSLGQRMEESSNGMDSQNLRLLMTDGSVSDISFKGMRDLNVLSMTSLPSLPRTTQLLESLRTLILDSQSLNSISGIGELVNLEILICRGTLFVKELPVEMSRLVRLMKLEISGCFLLRRIAPNIISSLVALKELEIVDSFRGWEAKGRERENAALSELECLSSLTCLTIRILDPTLAAQHMVLPLHQIVKYDIAIGYVPLPRGKFDKTLRMYLPGEITSLGNWVLECISRVEYLLLQGEGSNIVDLGQTQKMRKLVLKNCSTMRKLANISIGSTTVFPYLEYLKLLNLANLEDIYQIPKGSTINAFKYLKEVSIQHLPRLKHLWENNSTYHARLPQLEKLEISTCGMMEQVFLWNEEEEEKEIRFPKLKRLILRNMARLSSFSKGIERIEFPQLETLILRDMPRLSSFSKGIERIEFPQLTDMAIHNCPLLRSLVSITNATGDINNHDGCFHWFCNQEKANNSTYHAPLPQLEKLEISTCGMMEQVFLWNEEEEEKEIRFPKLKRLILRNMARLSSFSKGIERIEFPQLETLILRDMPRLSTFSKGIERIEFPQLTHMIIDCCPLLRSLVSITNATGDINNHDGCFHWFCNHEKANNSTYHARLPQLENLEISTCGMMEQVFLWNEEEEEEKEIRFPKLKRLILRNLPRLSSFSKGIERIEFPQLTNMTIDNCPLLRSLVSITKATGDINNHDGCLHWFCNQEKANNSTYHARLPQLENLEISTCGMMEQVFLWNEEEEEKEIRFPQLKRLILKDLARLSSFSKGIERIEFPQLTDMTIDNCPLLRSLVSITNATGDINNHDGCFHWFCNQEKVAIGGLKDLRIWGNGIISNSSSLWCDQIPTHGFFTGLEKLEISSFSNLRSLFSSSIASNLNNLRMLNVWGCKEMVKVIEDDAASCELSTIRLFPLLQHLRLGNLPKLEICCEWRSCVDVELPSLETVEIRHCAKIKRFNLGSLITPNLKNIDIEYKQIINTNCLNVILQQPDSRIEEGSGSRGHDDNKW